MKAWALLALGVAAEHGLRGKEGAAPVLVVHHKPPHHRHLELLAKESHTHHVSKGVDLSTLAGGDVATSGIIEGSGSFADEAGAALGAAPQPAAAGPEPVTTAAPAASAADVVFGGEAPTREELRAVHQQQAQQAASKPTPPYHVTLDLGPPPPLPANPPLAAIHSEAKVARTENVAQQEAAAEAAAEQAARQQVAEQQLAAQRAATLAAQQAAQQQESVHAAAQMQGQQATASATPTGITRPKGWDQCLKFSRFVKAQGVTGMELVKTWKATCEPAVSSGIATERYKVMCNALGGTVEPFAAQQDYDVEKLCDAVLAVFHDVTAVDVKASS